MPRPSGDPGPSAHNGAPSRTTSSLRTPSAPVTHDWPIRDGFTDLWFVAVSPLAELIFSRARKGDDVVIRPRVNIDSSNYTRCDVSTGVELHRGQIRNGPEGESGAYEPLAAI